MSVFVARTGTDIGFEQHPCLEPLGCRRPSGMHEGQYRFRASVWSRTMYLTISALLSWSPPPGEPIAANLSRELW
jgi:hypothetical protein